jgi:phospholipid-binding lipoprotein MlaA
MKKIVLFMFIMLSVLVSAAPVMALEPVDRQNSFPDLLSDEFLSDDEWDEGNDDDFDREELETISDPLEPLNRVFFTFNDKVYEWVLSPLTDGYIWVVPRELRESFGNFFFNLAAPVRFVNSLFQGELKQSGLVLSRFLINSTLGVYGLVDIAYLEFDIKPENADFGQTLGRWGVGDGIYICWPVVGPSSIRDSIGLVVDAYTHPIPYFHESRVLDVSYYTSNKLNTLSLNPDIYDDLKRFSLDPYVASRQAYYDYRKLLIEQR